MNPHYLDFLREMNAHEVKYFLVGAYAVMAYTEPRYTKDLDIAIDTTEENARRAFAALNSFGAQLEGLRAEDFTDPEGFYRLITPHASIDVLFGISPQDFGTAWANRLTVSVEGVQVPVIGLENLQEMKRLAGREQDKLDLAKLDQAVRLTDRGAMERIRSLGPNQEMAIDPDDGIGR